jgi:hypothetical protein
MKKLLQGGHVNNITLTKYMTNVFLGIGACALPICVTADQHQPHLAAASAEDCSRDLLMAYFPKPFVNTTLEHFNVPKDQWDAINKELAEKDKEIVKNVEEKAGKMTPNPLTDPQQRQAAVKLFRETLLDSFSGVMKAHGVKDEKQIQAMLDDIQQQKAKRFAQCMAPPGNPAGAPRHPQSNQRPPQLREKAPSAQQLSDNNDEDFDD